MEDYDFSTLESSDQHHAFRSFVFGTVGAVTQIACLFLTFIFKSQHDLDMVWTMAFVTICAALTRAFFYHQTCVYAHQSEYVYRIAIRSWCIPTAYYFNNIAPLAITALYFVGNAMESHASSWALVVCLVVFFALLFWVEDYFHARTKILTYEEGKKLKVPLDNFKVGEEDTPHH